MDEMKSFRDRWINRKNQRLAKWHDQEKMYHARIGLLKAKKAYRREQVGAAFGDWAAVFIAFLSFIFLISWQAYPDWDPNAILPTFVRSALIAGPIALGMWGVARALKPGSDVPRSMASKIPYGKVNADGTIGGTNNAGDDIHFNQAPPPAADDVEAKP